MGVIAVTSAANHDRIVCGQEWLKTIRPAEEVPIIGATLGAANEVANSRFRVFKVLYDPYMMSPRAQRLLKLGLRMEEYPQSAPNLPAPSQNLYELIQSGALVAYPDAAMRLAINQAIAIEGPRGWRIAKSRRSRLIRSTSLLH